MLARNLSLENGTNISTSIKNPFKEFKNTRVLIANIEDLNYERSQRLFDKYNLRPLSLKEILTVMVKNPDLKEKFKGIRFFINGNNSKLSNYYSYNDNGTLNYGKGKIEETLFVHSGNNLSSLYVATDYYTQFFESRYVLYANTSPYDILPSLICYKKDIEYKDYDVRSFSHNSEKQISHKEYEELYSGAVNEAIHLSVTNNPSKLCNIMALLKFLGRK
jgi:hypothetical protein